MLFVRNANFLDNHDDDPGDVLLQLDMDTLLQQQLILIQQQRKYTPLFPK